MIVSQLKDTQAQLTTPMKYLMGFNESYDKPDEKDSTYKKSKYIAPLDAVDMWRNVIQPAAIEMGLGLLPPTSGAKAKKQEYLGEFIAGCWDKRNDETAPCDVNLISAFSIHDFRCRESYWEENYTAKTGKFVVNLIDQLETQVGDSDDMVWADYVNDMPIWVTATNCNWDKGGFPTQIDVCERITGQAGKKYGMGSIKWFNQADNIARFAWYTTYNKKNTTKDMVTRLTNIDSQVLPPGRALLNKCSKKTDCAALP